ncbi:hypothetical protein V5J35_004447 [Endozoicomonas sp. NE40]|uniref:Uncharacterized protein n=1 Tax=Endozoicomonas lisbonensis TaxID=3120522 RepID=A0ABV2SNB8_9GAMM
MCNSVNRSGFNGFTAHTNREVPARNIKEALDLTSKLMGESPLNKSSRSNRPQGKPLSERKVQESIGKRILKGLGKGLAKVGGLAFWVIVRLPGALVCCLCH